MRLELGTFEVSDVVLGSETRYEDGVLTIDVRQLRERLLESGEFDDVGVDVVRPGDDVRVIHVMDAVEPRIRVSEPGTDFPGMLSLPRTVGRGRTHRLGGVVVTEVGEPVPGEPTYWREAIFDMAGDGARYSPFSGLINVVLTFHARAGRFSLAPPTNVFEGTPEALEFNRAVRVAGLKAAVYLAECTRELRPDHVESYEMVPSGDGLPKVVYLFQMQALYIYGQNAGSGGAIGMSPQLPTMIHPNEILDGALVNGYNAIACQRDVTYLMQKHALIQELYKTDGRDISFRGVVIFTNGDNVSTKERMSSYAAKLARLLGADGAILNYLGGGHPIVDVMLACQKLELDGVKTTLLLMEMANNPEDSGFVHFVPQANAIVSTGNYEQIVEMPPVSTVVGGSRLLGTDVDATGAVRVPLRSVLGSTNQFGEAQLRGRQY